MTFATTWIDLKIIILSEVSQTEKDKISYNITHMWNLEKKKGKNELIYKTEIESHVGNKHGCCCYCC